MEMTANRWFTDQEMETLRENGRRSLDSDVDHVPPVLLRMPDCNQRWLLTEINPHDDDMAYGLCDLGIGLPEMGEVRLSDLAAMTGPGMMQVERDRTYRPSPDLPVSRLDRMAHEAGRIIV
jgi:hypothetical protein